MEHLYKIKEKNDLIKDLDKAQGIVVIGINAFDVVDADGDVSLQGSFNRTVKNNKHRIKQFVDHQRTAINVGVPKEFIITKEDIAVVSQLNLNLSIGKDLFASYVFNRENGHTVEHSIGAKAIDYVYNSTNGLDVKEWMLLEYSAVGLGANEFTPLYDIKNEMDIQKAFNLIDKLAKQDYSDETKKKLENIFYAVLQFQKDGSPVFGSQIAPEKKAPETIEEKEFKSIIYKLIL